MMRLLAAMFLMLNLGACECCPETSAGFSRDSCCSNTLSAGISDCADTTYH